MDRVLLVILITGGVFGSTLVDPEEARAELQGHHDHRDAGAGDSQGHTHGDPDDHHDSPEDSCHHDATHCCCSHAPLDSSSHALVGVDPVSLTIDLPRASSPRLSFSDPLFHVPLA